MRTSQNTTDTGGSRSTFRFSASEWPQPKRMEVIREYYGRTIMQAEIDPIGDMPVDVEARMRALPGLGLAHINLSNVHVRRTRRHLFDDTVALSVSLAGSRSITQCGRE